MSHAAPCFELPTRRSTRELARLLAANLTGGDALILNGPLGAGKTFLVRALCRALGLDPSIRVVSPTFTLVRELPTRPPIAHADLYRLEPGAEGAEALGLSELRANGFVLIAEWGERYPGAIGPDVLTVSIHLGPRRACLSASGGRSEQLLGVLLDPRSRASRTAVGSAKRRASARGRE